MSRLAPIATNILESLVLGGVGFADWVFFWYPFPFPKPSSSDSNWKLVWMCQWRFRETQQLWKPKYGLWNGSDTDSVSEKGVLPVTLLSSIKWSPTLYVTWYTLKSLISKMWVSINYSRLYDTRRIESSISERLLFICPCRRLPVNTLVYEVSNCCLRNH